MAEEFKMPSAPSSTPCTSTSRSKAASGDDSLVSSCTLGPLGDPVLATTSVSTGLPNDLQSTDFSRYGYDGSHGNDYPKKLKDGKWAIAFDEDRWEDVVVDDIEGMDPSQFSSQSKSDIGTPVSLIALQNESSNFPSNDCKALVPYSDDHQLSNRGRSDDHQSPEGPSQNLSWVSTEFESKSEVHDIIPGIVGLSNLGNTCFLNSGLQCLFNNSSFIDYILFPHLQTSKIGQRRAQDKKLNHLTNNSLGSCFVSLFNKVWSKKRMDPIIKPSEFKDALGQSHLQFQDFRQHDCQEFLALLLGTLHDQFNTTIQAARSTTCSSSGSLDKKPLAPVLESDELKPEESLSKPDADPISSACLADSPKSYDSSSSVSSSSSNSEIGTSENGSIRQQPLPPDIRPFSDAQSLENNDQSNIIPIERLCTISSSGLNPSNALPIRGQRHNSCSASTSRSSSSLSRSYGQEKNEVYDNIREQNRTTEQVTESSNLEILDSDHTSTVSVPNSTSFSRTSTITAADLEKDFKISNSNVLVDSIANNKLMFDSQKYPRFRDNLRNEEVLDNLRCPFSSQESEQNKVQSLKRVKNDNFLNQKVLEASMETMTSATCLNLNQVNKSSNVDLEDFSVGSCRKKTKMDVKTEIEGMEIPVDGHLTSECTIDLPGESNTSTGEDDEGDASWNSYLSTNDSVIVDTFQGQFKSTVRCFSCEHVSVTYEPFMYLAVPLPRALEKQVVITYISCLSPSYGSHGPSPKQYLINVHKFDRLSKVQSQLRKILKEEASQLNSKFNSSGDSSKVLSQVPDTTIVLAEVKSNYILRLYEDYMTMKFVDDCNLYAFELQTSRLSEQSGDTWSPKEKLITPSKAMDMDDTLDNQLCINDDFDYDRKLEQKSPNLSPLEVDRDALDGCIDDTVSKSVISNWEVSSNMHVEDHTQDVWATCIVCLDYKAKTELLQHLGCNCIICCSCLDQHSSINAIEASDEFLCPTCQVKLKRSAYASLDQPPPQVGPFSTIVPVVFRVAKDQEKDSLFLENNWNTPSTGNLNGKGKKSFDIVAHPVLVEVPKSVMCNTLYSLIDHYVPFPFPYSLHYVKADGQSCCRCDPWTNTLCDGCEIYRTSSQTVIMPSDTIAVQFDPSFIEQPLNVPEVTSHESMNQKRNQDVLTLEDCIKAFHESEILDADNPWYCPTCCSNQRANKTLSIWRSPKTLMVYLKRFLFHEMQPIKVDDPVTFPMDILDMGQFTRKRKQTHLLNNNGHSSRDEEGNYYLQSFVCHSGGVSAGHYTAYARHGVDGNWYYFNDSHVTAQEPSCNDDRAYILFYEMKNDASDSLRRSHLQSLVSNHEESSSA